MYQECIQKLKVISENLSNTLSEWEELQNEKGLQKEKELGLVYLVERCVSDYIVSTGKRPSSLYLGRRQVEELKEVMSVEYYGVVRTEGLVPVVHRGMAVYAVEREDHLAVA